MHGCACDGAGLVDGRSGGRRDVGLVEARAGLGLDARHDRGGVDGPDLADRARRERGHGQNRAERLPRRFFRREAVHRRGDPPPRVRAETILGPRDDVTSGHGRRPLGSINDDLKSAAHRDVGATGLVDDGNKTGQRRQVGGKRGRQFLQQDRQVCAIQHEFPESLGERLMTRLKDENPALGHSGRVAAGRPRASTHGIPPLRLRAAPPAPTPLSGQRESDR